MLAHLISALRTGPCYVSEGCSALANSLAPLRRRSSSRNQTGIQSPSVINHSNCVSVCAGPEHEIDALPVSSMSRDGIRTKSGRDQRSKAVVIGRSWEGVGERSGPAGGESYLSEQS